MPGDDSLQDVTPFGPYQLVSRLGEGGMAQVFLAVKEGPLGFRKELAIKRIRSDVLRDNETLLKSLINEARLGGQLKHPNVVDTYEFGVVDDQHYIAMEYVNGLTLSELIRGARSRGVFLPPSAVIDMGCQLCDGLHYAHTLTSGDGEPLDLIHRDLKPSNIIVSMAGQAKIMDFGIARSAAAMFQTTASDAPKGTLAYMSPEQMEDPREIDPRSDLFALGAILFESLTGQLLLETGDARSLVYLLITGKYMPRLAALDEICPTARPHIERCLALDRDERYADADELGRDLRRLRDSMGSELGCREMMALVKACREGDERLSTVRRQVLERQGDSDPHSTGWPAFIDSLSEVPIEGSDPLTDDSVRPLEEDRTAGRQRTVTTLSRPDGLRQATLRDTQPPAAHSTPTDGTIPVRDDRSRRLRAGLALAVVFMLGVGVTLWAPWTSIRETPVDDGASGVGGAGVDEGPTVATGAHVEPAAGAGDPAAGAGTERDPGEVSPGVEPGAAVSAAADAPRDAGNDPEPVDTGGREDARPADPEPRTATESPPSEETSPAHERTRVRVTINTDPWSTWVLGGDAQGAGSHTPYLGNLPPGNYAFTLVEPTSGDTHTMHLQIQGDEDSIGRCWSFAKNGPC